jgi:hypothetical protein
MWNAEIRCHGDEPQYRDLPIVWDPPETTPRSRHDPPPPPGVHYPGFCSPFRTCTYCGSMHPEDLLNFLNAPRRVNIECPKCDWEHATEEERDRRWPLGAGAWSPEYTSHVCRVTMGGSDWKYGYPHKFYVYGMPNPIAGQLCVSSSRTWRDDRGDHFEWAEPHVARSTTQGKFYSRHLLDVTEPEFSRIAEAIALHAGIEFSMVDGKLMYAAPRPGYQQA